MTVPPLPLACVWSVISYVRVSFSCRRLPSISTSTSTSLLLVLLSSQANAGALNRTNTSHQYITLALAQRYPHLAALGR